MAVADLLTMTDKKTCMTKVMGIFKSMDAFLGPDFEKGLARLKSTTERSATEKSAGS